MSPEKTQLATQISAWLQRRTPTSAARRVAPLAAGVATDIGNVRKENQDKVTAARGVDYNGREFALIAVSDGIGGMKDGGLCAAISLGAFLASVNERLSKGEASSLQTMLEAAKDANQAVFNRLRGDGGSTIAAVLVRPDQKSCWLSIGDSRVYRLDGRELAQASVDDTIAGQLAKDHNAEAEQSKLLQYVGMGRDLEPHVEEFSGHPQMVLVTSDGAHYFSRSPNFLGRLVLHAPDPGTAAKRIVDVAKWHGGPDNASVGLIDLGSLAEREQRSIGRTLEVWDAFGELQIVVAEKYPTGDRHPPQPQPQPQIKPESEPSSSNRAVQEPQQKLNSELPHVNESKSTPPPALQPVVAPDLPGIDLRSDSPDGGKAGKKTRRRRKKTLSNKVAPQLVVEFSTKLDDVE